VADSLTEKAKAEKAEAELDSLLLVCGWYLIASEGVGCSLS
jgi:hypothetical protein